MKNDQYEKPEGRIEEYSTVTPEFADQIRDELNKLVYEPIGIDHIDAEIEIYNFLHAQTMAIMSDDLIPYANQARAAKITHAQGEKIMKLIKAAREKL